MASPGRPDRPLGDEDQNNYQEQEEDEEGWDLEELDPEEFSEEDFGIFEDNGITPTDWGEDDGLSTVQELDEDTIYGGTFYSEAPPLSHAEDILDEAIYDEAPPLSHAQGDEANLDDDAIYDEAPPLSHAMGDEANLDDEAIYDEAPPVFHAASFADGGEGGSPPEFSVGITPVSEAGLMEEIERGHADVLEYDEAPPEGHDHIFNDDSSEEEFVIDDDGDTVIVDCAPPDDFELYYSQFTNDYDNGSNDNFIPLPESTSLWDKTTLLGKVVALGTFKHAKTVTSKDNKEQAKNALRIADKITKIPLGPIWHRTTQTFIIVFFLANITSAIVDIALSYDPLYFKLTALIFGIVEQLGLGILWLFYRRKRKANPDYGQKKQQYVENILHEVLLYPIVIISVVGFASDRLYNPSDAFQVFQLALLVVDIVNLVWAQCVRMFMIQKFMKDLQGLLNTSGEKVGFFGMRSPGRILERAYMTTVGNTILMFYLIVLFAFHEDTDNPSEGVYLMSWRSALLALSLTALPVFSIILFLLTNSFWVLKIFMTINLRVSSDEEFQENLTKKYGHTVSDAMNLAVKQGDKTKKRLEGMNQMPLLKKVFFGLTTFWMIPLILLWQVLAALPLVTILAYGSQQGNLTATTHQPVYYIAASMVYCGLLLIFNAHLLLLALALDIMIPIVFLCFLIYPISLPILFRKQMQVRPEVE